VHDAVTDALRRFPTVVLLLWLPVKLRADFDTWYAALARALTRPVLASLLWMHPPDSRAALNGSALVLVNPPYLLEQGMREWLPELRSLLAGDHATAANGDGCEVVTYQK
jgi:23S rRNA (adenine2030-N6)-methyltransferase